MDAAQPGEAGVLKSGDHAEDLGLRAVFHLRLEADDVVQRSQGVIPPKLDHRVGFFPRLVGVRQPDRLHRAVAQGVAAALGHDLDGQAAVEIARRLALAELGLLGGQKGVDEGVVFVARHGAVDIGGPLLLGLALVIAGLPPGHAHVDGVGMDDGGDGVEEGERVGPGFRRDGLPQGGRGQRAGGDDPVAVLGQGGDLAFLDGHQRMGAQRGGHVGREGVAVHGQRAARGQLVAVGGGHDEAARRPHLPVQLAHGVVHVVVRAEAVGTDHLGAVAGAMGEGADLRAHLVQDHGNARPGGLPRGFGARHAGADDMDGLGHGG